MKLKDAYSLGGKLCNLDSILKSRDITLPTKVHLVKAMVFPVVMYEYESWLWRNTVTDFILGGFKITVDGNCSHEIKRRLLLGRKAMTTLDNILKSRDITLLTKVLLVKAMDFPVVMYECESWTLKKAKCLRIDAFELWCWRRLESPLDCRRSNQSVLKGVSPE